ncbi:HEX-like protein [Mya arenaria]|uniref:beta-N-acetylhexosaminidase n=1 Tax=Mya arenaria TaxID=6604 RepID=A0ABY7DL76_MYAAR|nr:HEX-like protein [Mya arenaria]
MTIEDAPRYEWRGLKKYFVTRVAEIAAAKKVKLSGWDDGFLNGQSSPEPIPISEFSNAELFVNTWNNIWEWGGGSNAYKFANAGFKVILTQATNLYFDHPQEPDPEERGLYWATRFTDTKKVFRFMPESLLLENGEMQVSTTYPGLGVEVSKDNGTSWQQVPEEIVNNPNRSTVVKSEGDWHSVKLRTTFSLYGAKASKLSCGLSIGHVNGGLFYIEPTPGSFPGIPAMQSLNPCIYNNKWWMVSRTDNMPNWFVTAPGMLEVNIVATAQDSSKQIKFEMKQNIGGSDAYEINISPETHTVVIQAQEASGAFYGAQTLLSLVEDNDRQIPKATIKDAPRFGYRGVMLDVARNFKPKNWILKFIDVMATYKLNKLHLHLSDDEAWRIEIPGIPELTEIASKRCHSEYDDECVVPQLGSGPDTDTLGSGFYTVDDYREILDYAMSRHIEVIPEIDMPGHSAAAITVMEKREDDIDFMESHAYGPLPQSWLLYDHKFVERVVNGLKEIHRPVQPLRIFHMGGDEVARGSWDESRECFDNVDLRGKDTVALQRVFMNRVARIISDKGLNLGVWEDGVYADDKPNPITDFKSDVFVYPWNNRWGTNKVKRSSEFADAGYKVILPLATHLYFDMPQEPDPESRGHYWATRFIDAHKVFGLMPDNIFANVDVDRMGNSVSLEDLCGNAACPQPNKTENIIGLQACMWAEVMRTEEQFHNMAFPRLLALAERAWHRANWEEIEDWSARDAYRNSDWEAFADVLGYKELPRLEKKQVLYLVEPPGARVEGNVLMTNTRYPNHLVEISMDGGETWNEFQKQSLANGEHTFHFRTKSPVLGRVSRPIELIAVVEGDGRAGSAVSSSPTSWA